MMGWNVFTEVIPLLSTGTFYAVSCERSDKISNGRAEDYWDKKELRLPDKAEAYTIYTHKSELERALIVAGYTNNYFQTADRYWTSSEFKSGNYFINNFLDMSDGDTYSGTESDCYSFGIGIIEFSL